MGNMEPGFGWFYPPGTPGRSSREALVRCECGDEFEAVYESELGQGSLQPEECPSCGSGALEVID